MSVTDIASLALIGVEFYVVGALSAIDWPLPTWPSARIALRVLVGAIAVAAAELVLALLSPGFASVPLAVLVAGGLALLIRVAAQNRRQILPASPRRHPEDRERASRGASREVELTPGQAARETATGLPERAAWLLLALLLLAATIRSLLVPESGWDAYSHWGLRAQAYALAGTVTNAGSEHEYYPPLVPLLEAWLYLHTGAPNIDLGKTVAALLGSGFAICLAWHLRLVLTPAYLAPLGAAAIVASTATLLEDFWTGQADLALTAWLTLATLATWQYQRSRDNAWLTHAALFAAAAGLTKLEGTPRLLTVAAAAYLITRDIRPTIALAIPALCATLLWTVLAQRAGISANSEHLGQLQLAAVGPILLALVQVFGGVRTGGAIVVAVLAWLLAYRRIPPLLGMAVVGQLALTLVALLFSDADPAIEVRTSATRLIAQFLPIALVAAAIGLRKQSSNL